MAELFITFEHFFSHGSSVIWVLFFVLIHFLSEPLRWFLYIQHTGLCSFHKLLKIFSLTALGTYVLPFKLGIPLRVYLLNKKADIPLPIVSSLLVIDGLSYYLAWVVAGGMGFLYLFGDNLLEFLENVTVYIIAFLTITGLLFLARHIIRNKWLKLKNRWQSIHTCHDFFNGVRLHRYLNIALTVVIDISSHIFRHLFLCYMLGIDLSLPIIAAITTLSVMTGLISMMPMGLVGYDASMILLLQQAGVGLETALLIPVLNRFANLFVSFLLGTWGGIGMGISPISGLKKMAKSINKN